MISSLLSKLNQLNVFYIASILLTFAIICYGISLNNGLFFDDEQFIYSNQAVKLFDVPTLISKSLTSGVGQASNYYRPLLFLGFSIEYQLFNANGFIYHLDSLFLHLIGAILLFILIKKIFHDQLLSLLTSLLFLIHPVQTEAVAYASGRGDPLSFVFILATLLLVINANKKNRIFSFITLIAALLSKEIALMSPGLIFLVILFSKKSFSRTTIRQSFTQTLPYAVIVLSYFILRITILNFNNTLNFYNSKNIYSDNLFVRLYTFLAIIPEYFGLLIYPKTLFMERDVLVKIITSPNLSVGISILVAIISFTLAFVKRKTNPIILFSMIWIVITFIPTSGILPINGIFYEHFLYYPSVGFFLLISYFFLKLFKLLPNLGKYCLILIMIVIISLLSIRTIYRNNDWHDPIRFYTQTLSHVQSARIYNNLAMAYVEQGQNEMAIRSYKKAISISDNYPETHYNLANAYISLNNYSEAEIEYKKAIKILPEFYFAYIKLYQLYKITNNINGINNVSDNLLRLGKNNPDSIKLLHQLENN